MNRHDTEPPAPAAAELAGTWRLVSYVDVDEAGNVSEGPLGPAPEGLLIYHEQGHMAVSMMRTGAPAAAGPGERAGGAPPARQHETFMGYAGRWRLADERTVVHHVAVSAHGHQVGQELVRELERDGDRIVLHGTAVIGGRPQRRRLRWERVRG
ncbi:lipocalin-like domain-containing protein [Streptomyces sp. HU2014]|uniref:EsmH2 n=1 Tax=Streptomyces albireticuli TaxID=1940 RepID=A0A1Z2KWD4_9ACTN|nr:MULTISPECIES: lipocalin-like domain-containing protein [Streptomyces]ARZ66353.1 EsmH2 [Streptomyces albireticuli]UQI46578.1 lipocalin-like domain-containing protein [Streptomyces sp. HU2014]